MPNFLRSEEICDAATETILKRAADLCPEMLNHELDTLNKNHGFGIRHVYVARRPMRRGGLRLEKDNMTTQDGQDVPLIHCYGAGPSGYKISWGVANRVERLVADLGCDH